MKRNESYCNWPALMIKEEWIKGGIFDLPRSGLLEPIARAEQAVTQSPPMQDGCCQGIRGTPGSQGNRNRFLLKTLEDLKFACAPELDRFLVRHLCGNEYVKKRKNVILLDTSGTGKPHLASALGVEACRYGIRPLVDMVTSGGREGFTSADLDRDLASAGDGVTEKCRNDSQCLAGTESSSNLCCISDRISVAKRIASSQINKAMPLQKVRRPLL